MKKSILVFILTLASSYQWVCAQTLIGVVDYMRAEDPEAYLKIEDQWKKVHEERIKAGMIVGWAVYQVMFKTVEDPYNFVTISWYDSFSKLDKGIPDEIINSAMPKMSEREWRAFIQQTEKARKLVSSGVFHQQLSCSGNLDKNGTYYILNEINVVPGKSKEYLEILEDIYKPVYEAEIEGAGRTSWSLWAKWPGNMKDFQYVTAEGFVSLEQIEYINFSNQFRKIHPGKNLDEISGQIESLRTLVKSEMWKVVFKALK